MHWKLLNTFYSFYYIKSGGSWNIFQSSIIDEPRIRKKVEIWGTNRGRRCRNFKKITEAWCWSKRNVRKQWYSRKRKYNKKVQKNVIKDKENTKKQQKNDTKSNNKKNKNKKDKILALKEQEFMNKMINTAIMTESEVELVNSSTTSIIETSIPDAFSNKESDSSYMPDISFSDDDSDDELMRSKVRFITSNSPTLMQDKKIETAAIPENSKGHPKIAGKVHRKELKFTNFSTPNNSGVQARETSKNWLKIKELNKQEQPQTVHSKGDSSSRFCGSCYVYKKRLDSLEAELEYARKELEEEETIIQEGEYKGESTAYSFYSVMPDLFLLAQIMLAVKLSAFSAGGLRFASWNKEKEVGLSTWQEVEIYIRDSYW